MDSTSPTNPVENINDKPSFHKRTSDAANRKYRRHSPGGSDSSSSGGSSKRRNRSPPQPEIRNRRDDKKDSTRHHDRHMHGASHGYAKNENPSRYHGRRHAGDEDRDYHRSSRAGSDKYPRDKYSRDNRDYNHDDRDAGRVKVAREEIRDRHLSSDYINDHKCSREGKRVSGIDSTSGRTYGHKESDGYKEKINREAETEAKMIQSQEPSALKKLKSYDSEEEKPPMSFKGVVEKSVESAAGPSANQSEAAGDVNVAKVASMKAAELVNKNLAGSSYMSTDQKKKLLWGNKKNTSTIEKQSGTLWNQQLFEDRERQEKFNKLMGVKESAASECKAATMNAEMKQKLEMDLEKQYTAGLRRRDGRTVGLGL